MIATNPNQLAWDEGQTEDGAEDDFDTDAALDEMWASEAAEAESDGDTEEAEPEDEAETETEEAESDGDTEEAEPQDEQDEAEDEQDVVEDGEAEPEFTQYDEHEPDGEEEEEETVEPRFANVFEWVDGFFIKVIRRRINPDAGKGLSWDERWWMYPEVVGRLKALHQAWEKARADKDPAAMSNWWIHHLEPHLRVILDGDTGPMSHAPTMHPSMGSAAVPAAIRAALLGE
ncbi:DUF4913 domain-containing protein [Rhodococcus sp. ACT016]|uniref:DUF4913 domain-containing protein n=1 Tax=Rhodococcus sp. ACT016 TaxID=3134808 RepID=UPI003D2697E7